ncbi:MAG: hypothetical protein JW388_1272 [Nitrospira sp.]|nr:hypothetical protein [Nitrospira sp.]
MKTTKKELMKIATENKLTALIPVIKAKCIDDLPEAVIDAAVHQFNESNCCREEITNYFDNVVFA